MIQKSCCFILFTFFSIATLAQEENYINYTVEDGLPSNMVYCVQQDDRGFMWFGTDSGLSRYDGYEFINYSLNDGLPDTEILHFFKDSQSRIWFYTLNGKVGFLENDSIYSSKNTDWLKELDFDNRITGIIEVNEKLIFTAVSDHFKIVTNRKVKVVRTETRDANSICYCDDKYYLFSNRTVYEVLINDKKVDIKKRFSQFPYRVTYPICIDKIIYAFDLSFDINGLLKLGDNHFFYTPLDKDNFTLNVEVINGNLYLLTKEGILGVSFGENFYEFSPLKFTSSMYQDREGNKWYTSIKSGIYFQPKTKVKFDGSMINIDAISTIDELLYIAHSKNTISTKNINGQKKDFIVLENSNTTNFIAKNIFQQILIGRNDGIYIGQEKAYPGGALSITFRDSLLYIGSRGRIITENNTNLNRSNISGNVMDLHAFSHDSILVATDNGMFVANRDSITSAYKPPNFSKDPRLQTRINKIIVEKNKIWIATSGNGIVQYFSDHRTKKWSMKDGLASNVILDMIIQDSTIWTVTPVGIHKIEQHNGTPKVLSIDRSDGLVSSQINDFEYFNDSIYLATNDGLYIIPTNINLIESNQFNLFIDEVLDENSKSNEHVFQPNTTSVQIKYKAIVYRNHNSLTYQYQLKRLGSLQTEEKWIDTDFNQVNFLNLPPNNYAFFVRAKTKNSDWSPPISYEFEIKPAFWQTVWFPIVVICLIIGIAITYINQVNRNRLAKKNLEKAKISAELTALKAQINPHFLFNVLNSIQSFILENEKDIAQEYLVKYGRLMRMVLEHSDRLIVSLHSELEMLKLYTDLEMLRLRKGFDLEINLSPYCKEKNIQVPSMVIQPFIENAIWHGLSPLKEKGKIILDIDHIENHIEVKISDNGVGFEKAPKKRGGETSSGVRLVKERLNLIQGPKSFKNYLEIESKSNVGTCIILRFSDSLT